MCNVSLNETCLKILLSTSGNNNQVFLSNNLYYYLLFFLYYINTSLNPLPIIIIDELGNRCYQRLLRAVQKYQVQEEGSMATL